MEKKIYSTPRVMKFSVVVMRTLVAAAWIGVTSGLDNGLALTPPMGWQAWERFRCNIDCKNDPRNCISEKLFMEMAVRMAEDGYLDAGYNILSLDDCWVSRKRDNKGRLQADPDRFPSGIQALISFVHNQGLKFGLFSSMSMGTSFPEAYNYLDTDAKTFGEWGVDYVKMTGCFPKNVRLKIKGYFEFGWHLNQTKRPIVYSCSWPRCNVSYKKVVKTCNLWRNYKNVEDSWASVTDIMDHYAKNQDTLAPLAGPGHWNDPDMLIIGNFGLSYDQAKTQMAIWSILAAPLIMSVDLRDIKDEFRDILQNSRVIAVNQDPLGRQGRRIKQTGDIEYWRRTLLPVLNGEYSYALAIRNRGVSYPTRVSFFLKDLGISSSRGYMVEDLFESNEEKLVMSDETYTVWVNPSGVVMLRCSVIDPPI